MKKTTIQLAAIMLLFCAFYTKADAENSSTQLNKVKMVKHEKEQIETLLMNYQGYLNTSNAQKSVELYKKDGVFMPSGGPTATGTESLKGAYQYVFSQIQLNIKFNIEEIVIKGNFAHAITTSKGTVLIHATGVTAPEENRELFLFEKENGEWKIAQYMFNKTK